VYHGLGQVELHLGHADVLDGVRRRGRHGQRRRVGHADVLAGEDDHPAGDEPGVLAGHQHPGQPVQRRVDVGATHALDERAHHVVVRVAVAVVAQRGHVDRLLGGGEVDLLLAQRLRAGRGGFQRREGLADVAGCQPYQMIFGGAGEGDGTAQAALVGERAADQQPHRVVVDRLEGQQDAA
jgi:hypothetical protein